MAEGGTGSEQHCCDRSLLLLLRLLQGGSEPQAETWVFKMGKTERDHSTTVTDLGVLGPRCCRRLQAAASVPRHLPCRAKPEKH